VAYLLLALAISAEVAGTSLLKASEGLTRLWPTAGTVAGYLVATVLLAQAVKTVPVGVAYAMWSGLGTAAIAAIGAAFLGEPLNAAKVIGIALIIGGVVILNLGGAA
jgi:small multidrug resistance pump